MKLTVPAVRGLIQICKLLASTGAGLILMLLALMTTENGSRWLLRGALSLQDSVAVARIDGTLLHELSLRQLHYRDRQGFSVAVDAMSLRWRAAELLFGHLHVEELRLHDIAITGRPGAGETSGGGEIPAIPLTIGIDSVSVTQMRWQNGDNEQLLQRLSLSVALTANALTVSNLALTLPHMQVDGHSRVQLQSDWPVSAELHWSYAQQQATLKGRLQVRGDMPRYHFDSVVTGSAESEQHGIIRLTGTEPEFTLSGSWRKLQWPLTGPAQFGSNRGQFHLEGTLAQYQAELNADISALEQPDFSVDLNATGNRSGIAIERLLLKPARGRVVLNGSLSWKQAIGFDLGLSADQLDPSDFGADIPGRLDLTVHGKGQIGEDRYAVDLTIDKLSGSLFDRPIQGGGRLKLANRQVDIDRFRLSAGPNRLLATGQLTEQRADIDLRIAAPDLRSAWPTLNGVLNGDVSITGSLGQPVIKANLDGRNLRFVGYSIAALSLQADYAHDTEQPSTLDFSARNLRLAENEIDRITLQGRGTQGSHSVRLQLQAPLLDLNLDGTGQWDGTQWRGEIGKLSIDQPQLKQWRLASPVLLIIENTGAQQSRIDLPDSCLLQDMTRLCLSAHGWPATQLDGTLLLTNWPMASAQPWLPDGVALEGLLSAHGQFSYLPERLTADIDIDVPKGLIRLKDKDNVSHEQPITASSLRLQYRQDHLQSLLQLGLSRDDFITAEIDAGPAGAGSIRRLAGTVAASIADMTLIDSLLPDISRLQGRLNADFKLHGTTEQPRLNGSAQWRNGQFEIPRLGSRFDKIDITVASFPRHADRLLLDAAIASGQGTLSGQGHLGLQPDQNFPLQLTLTGKQFKIMRLPEAEVVVSPNLTVHKSGNLTRIDGQITIDNARVELKTLPESAVAPSPDEVIVDAKQPATNTIDPSRLNARIAIDFGDDSRFAGFGLKTRLGGKLEYLLTPEQQSLQGRAEMKEASYRAYGQDLTIRKGEFLFNGPADNPWLNIEAIRKAVSDNVTAVLNVTGPLKSPETKVFTEPSLPESEALSYLVTGKSSKSLGKSDGTAVANAAFNYGAGQLSWLSDQLGIDEFEFEQGDTIGDSAVRLGQYLNPDLYIGVTMGLFATKYAANLRYRLSKHFSISTRAGESQRIDLKYQLETD